MVVPPGSGRCIFHWLREIYPGKFMAMAQYLIYGIVLGLSAGFAPGPLLTLVVAETLQHGVGAGIKVALAPLLTDAPIILFSLLVLRSLTDFHALLGLVSLTGGGLLLFLGWQSFRVRAIDPVVAAPSRSVLKGVLTNVLSPHPYLFWITVGGPLTMQALNRQAWRAVAFVAGFYLCLIGAKLVLALVAGKAKSFLSGYGYRLVVRGLGLLLVVLAGLLFYDGWQLLQPAR